MTPTPAGARPKSTHSALLLRHQPLGSRALANAERSTRTAIGNAADAARRACTLALLLLPLVLWSCDGHNPAQAAQESAATQARLAELVAALTPLKTTETSDVTDKKFLQGQKLLAELRAGGRDVGLEALRVLRITPTKDTPRPLAVERGLLDVAAHAAPEDARPLLAALVTQYGASLELRTEATLLLAETSPAAAIEVLEPMVAKARPTQTWPPQEFLVQAWVNACEKTGRSPVKELADVATNLFMDETARIRATKELGKHTEPLATQALQAILVESTGDGYLRRMAAQGIRDSLPAESACAIFEKTAEHEADMNFAKFLADLLDKNCKH
jgi:hypothetical protein